MSLIEVIAEAGSNHNGSLDAAFRLVDIAADSGASSVKFQFIDAAGLYLPAYPVPDGYVDNKVFNLRKKEEIDFDSWKLIWQHAKSRSINISASVFCRNSINMLKQLGADYVKIASTDLTNHHLIDLACQSFKRVIISTGMASLAEVLSTSDFVRKNHPSTEIIFMHCVSLYPCDLAESNIGRIDALSQILGVKIGYSDHTEDTYSSLLALAKGATIFEKHFTYDKGASGFDHRHAMAPTELKTYITTLNHSFASLNSKPTDPSPREAISKIRARRGVYASRDLPVGHVLTEDDLLYVRPSTTFSCNSPDMFIGMKINHNIRRFSAIGLSSEIDDAHSNWEAANNYWNNEMKEKKM
tara:strand:- start:14387 stop:15454 length:1068 start_codon:yes stop_codon:yes gene_type:complete